jgi:8-hydroxy-5-deazaflavin:NADPH oxidoreductase
MKVGILGSGDVGRRLSDGLIELGHMVKIGTRDPNKDEVVQWVSNHVGEEEEEGKALSGTFAEAASFGEMIVIATSWDGTSNAIKMADPKNFARKVVIDVTNPLDFSKGMPPRLAVGHTDSAGEIVQRLLSESKVVKAFNIVGNPHMVHPNFHQGGPPTMFICGNDENAKKTITDSILTPFGWETIDIGGIEESRLIEPLALLWISLF